MSGFALSVACDTNKLLIGDSKQIGGYVPIISAFDHKRCEIRAEGIGPVTLVDVRTHLLNERTQHGLSYPEVIDTRGADISFSPADIRQVAEILHVMTGDGPLGRTAVLVSNDLTYEMVRTLAEMVADVCEVKPFRHHEEAQEWLTARP